jgi:hypothetical protein
VRILAGLDGASQEQSHVDGGHSARTSDAVGNGGRLSRHVRRPLHISLSLLHATHSHHKAHEVHLLPFQVTLTQILKNQGEYCQKIFQICT